MRWLILTAAYRIRNVQFSCIGLWARKLFQIFLMYK